MMLTKIRSARFRPNGFTDEKSLVEGIAKSCAFRKTAMLTGNYSVKESQGALSGNPRLLGEEMLLTIELAARVYGKCLESGITPPAVIIVPNDIVSGIFQSSEERIDFKAGYVLPGEIATLLGVHGLTQEPAYMFTRDYVSGREDVEVFRRIRQGLKDGSEKLAVIFESYAQNLASRALHRGRIFHEDEIEERPNGRRALCVPVDVIDTFSQELEFAASIVTITNPNGAPFCSFAAATLFRMFEKLGFEQMVNTFITNEYPCVDKAATAYRYLYGGTMEIRNIYLNGSAVELDDTIR
jgi:hypothetical protein